MCTLISSRLPDHRLGIVGIAGHYSLYSRIQFFQKLRTLNHFALSKDFIVKYFYFCELLINIFKTSHLLYLNLSIHQLYYYLYCRIIFKIN